MSMYLRLLGIAAVMSGFGLSEALPAGDVWKGSWKFEIDRQASGLRAAADDLGRRQKLRATADQRAALAGALPENLLTCRRDRAVLRRGISLCPSAASRRSRLGHFLGCCWFWRSDHAGPKLSTHSALKPNLAQVRVLLAHSFIVSCARPFKTFFSPYPIVSSRRHRALPSLGPPQQQKIGVPKDTDMISIRQNLAQDNLRFLPFWAIALLHKP